MRTRKIPHAVFAFAFTVFVTVYAALCGGPDSARIAVLLSHDIKPHQEVLKGFQQHLSAHGHSAAQYDVYPLEGDASKAADIVEKVGKTGVRLVLTLGSFATRAARGGAGDVPVIGGLILNADDLKGAKNATGVFLEFPVETQFEWLRRFLPDSRNIGVIYNGPENGKIMERAARLAEQMGLALCPEEIQAPNELPAALDRLAKKADVLWGVPDKMVLTQQTAQHILLFSYRNRIPFVGLSSSWVKAGALYALDWDYTDLGTQCAEIALEILGGTEPRSIPAQSPRKVVYAVNLRTARHMKTEIPKDLVQGARDVY